MPFVTLLSPSLPQQLNAHFLVTNNTLSAAPLYFIFIGVPLSGNMDAYVIHLTLNQCSSSDSCIMWTQTSCTTLSTINADVPTVLHGCACQVCTMLARGRLTQSLESTLQGLELLA